MLFGNFVWEVLRRVVSPLICAFLPARHGCAGKFLPPYLITDMANTILVGAQWGDEGKGKIIDFLTEKADIVVRSQGGNNAGHTVIVGDTKYILHLIPSGILRAGKKCVIANGVVLDPIAVAKEIDGLREKKVKVTKANLLISDCAHLVLPYHRAIDEQRELKKGKNKIGTTKRGIGPAYGDKAARVGLRMSDLMQPELFSQKLKERVKENNAVLEAFGAKGVKFKEIEAEYLEAAEKLRPFVGNTVVYLHEALKAGKEILFEGAQGTFLDLDHGTYPYVTSSNTTAGGACTGSGVPPHRMDRVLGVMKAYTTRVGEGPFPTENDEFGDMLHGMGREFGSTTGRARRCGWFDAVATRYAGMVNGIDDIAVTNLDGLDSLATIKICTHYKRGNKKLEVPPSDMLQLTDCKPVYIEMPGWQTPTHEAKTFGELPPNAQAYLHKLAELTQAKLTIASVGPNREQTIVL
ncbi:MAG: Adenylosuccinate synthase [Chthoniobacteraceae bacterium]|nr:Adenylosuccinate synthase [Chthoniobacteraceae bacterium]